MLLQCGNIMSEAKRNMNPEDIEGADKINAHSCYHKNLLLNALMSVKGRFSLQKAFFWYSDLHHFL